MSLGNASILALLGTLLLSVLLVAAFVNNLVAVARGLVASAVVLSSFVQAFAAVSLALFFYVFYRSQR